YSSDEVDHFGTLKHFGIRVRIAPGFLGEIFFVLTRRVLHDLQPLRFRGNRRLLQIRELLRRRRGLGSRRKARDLWPRTRRRRGNRITARTGTWPRWSWNRSGRCGPT